MRKWILWIIVVSIMISMMTGCIGGSSGCNNSFTNLIGNSSFGGGSGGTPNLVNDAKHIDTNGTDWYNSILFDPITYKYYISGHQGDTTKKLALISINPELTLNYSKYYEVQDSSNNTLPDVGLMNLWYKDNSTFYVGGWISSDGINYHGIIGEVNKNTGQITLKKIFQNIIDIDITSDGTNIYGVSEGGYVLKLDNNYNIVSSKRESSSGFVNISISNNYIITYDGYNYGVVVIDKNLNNAVRFNNSIMSHAALVDNNNKLYYIDQNSSTNNLVLAKVDINNLSNPTQDMVKEYSWNSISFAHQIGFSLDGNIIVGITTNESPNNIVLLKINKNDFSIMNQVKLSAKGGGSSQLWGVLNMMLLPDGGFVISRYINLGSVGYILKGPSDLNIGDNCVFNVTNPNIELSGSDSYTISTTNLTLNDVTINEIPVTDYTLVEQNISTFVGCLSPAPNILNNRNGGDNEEIDNLTGARRKRSNR